VPVKPPVLLVPIAPPLPVAPPKLAHAHSLTDLPSGAQIALPVRLFEQSQGSTEPGWQ
jgi:hypothetical protein